MIGYFKAAPTEFVIHYASGKVLRKGPGLSFFFLKPTANLVVVPVATTDASFVFNELSLDFQGITVQGQLVYRVTDPERLASLLNFTIDPATRKARTNDPEKLVGRIVSAVHSRTRDEVHALPLRQSLERAPRLAADVLARVREDPVLKELGVAVLDLSFLSVRPTPEIGKALEAELREALQRKADEAIYARRAAAVEQERRIKENELATETALEEQRKRLLALRAENVLAEAESDAKAAEIRLRPFLAVEPRMLVALGLRDMGARAEKIGQLVVSPDLLAQLLQGK